MNNAKAAPKRLKTSTQSIFECGSPKIEPNITITRNRDGSVRVIGG